MLNSCPYQDCTQTGIASETQSCPKCKRLLNWCRVCSSANQMMGRYCRYCGKELGQNQEWKMFKSDFSLAANAGFELTYPIKLEPFLTLWPEKELGARIDTAPIAAYGELICVCADSSGSVFFLNQQDGSITKKFALGDRIIRTPAANSIYISIATSKNLYSIILLPDKKLLSPYKLKDPNEQFSSHLVTEGNSVYLNTFSKSRSEFKVYRFNPEKREPLWKSEAFISKLNPTTPLIFEDHLLIGTNEGNIIVLDKEKGECRAQLEDEELISEGINTNVSPAFSTSLHRAYLFDKRGGLHTVNLNRQNGLKIEEFRISSFGTSFINDFAMSEGCILISCDEGVINSDVSGSINWNTKAHNLGNMRTTPVICGKVGLVGENGFVYCFDLTPGQNAHCVQQQFSAKGDKLFVVAANKRFFVTSDKGKVGAYTLNQ